MVARLAKTRYGSRPICLPVAQAVQMQTSLAALIVEMFFRLSCPRGDDRIKGGDSKNPLGRETDNGGTDDR